MTTVFTTVGDLAKECEDILRIAIVNHKLGKSMALYNAIWEYLAPRPGETTIGKLVVRHPGPTNTDHQFITSPTSGSWIRLELDHYYARAYYSDGAASYVLITEIPVS